MNILCIFAKLPISGRTKSRLGNEISMDSAAQLSNAMLKDLINQFKAIKDIKLQVWLSPYNQSEIEQFEDLFTGLETFTQVGKDLGERMKNTFSVNLNEYDNSQVIIIGSDCIDHTVDQIENYFTQLSKTNLVVQPAQDGGYVLIGMNKCFSSVFDGIKWGTSTVYDQTIDVINNQLIPCIKLPLSFDVDTKADLNHLVNLDQLKFPWTSMWYKNYIKGNL